MTFRRRLLLASLTTLVVGLGALVVAGNVLLDARAHSETSTLLRSRSDAQLASLDVAGGRIAVRETPYDHVLDRSAWVLQGDRLIEAPAGASPQLTRAAVALARQGRVTESEPVNDVRMRAVPVRARAGGPVVGSAVVAVSAGPIEHLQKQVLVGSVVIAGLVVLAGALAIRSALDGALQPVVEMTDAAEAWGAEDLDQRFDLGPARDELTGLAHTLDGLLARIAAARRHEQRFAAEVAHELRTPLARLRGRAELALRARGTGADAQRTEALEAVVAQVADLDAAITALLAVARREMDPGAGTVDLAALAGELEDVEVQGPAALPTAEGDPEVVRRALAPLVDNARRHARSRVVVELASGGGRVWAAVRDDGPGVDPALGERVFEPGVRGAAEPDADGAGLGLPLARRLARSCGGDVVRGDGPGGCFVLVLPELDAA